MNISPRISSLSAASCRLVILSASLMVAITLTQSLSATSLYWDINGATANTGTTASGAWDGANAFWNTDSTGTGGTPQAVTTGTDDLFFSSGTGLTGASAVVITGAVAANGITFEEGTVTLSGTSTPSLTLGAGGLTFNNGTGANVISAPVVLSANTTFTHNDNSTQTLSGGLSGAFNVEVNATSTGGIILSGASTGYSGTTTLTAGALTAQGAANNVFTTLGTGGINLNGGTLNLRSNGAANGGANIITGNGTTGNNVTIGSSAVTINVNNNGGNAQNTFSFNDLSIGTGQLTVSGGNNYSLRFGGITTLTGNATINTTSSSLSLVGAIGNGSGGYGFTKTGAAATYASTGQTGVLTVSGANTYTGVTSVLGGILVLNGNAPSGANGTLGNATSAVLLGDTSGSVNAYLMANNFTIGRNVIVQSGNTGTAFLGSSSTSNAAGTTYSGSVTLGTASGTGHGVTLVSGAFHTTTFSGVIQDPASLSGAGGVVTIGDATIANFLTGTFSPNPSNSSSLLIISGANTYSGGTIINAVTPVRINNTNAFGTGNLSIVSGTIQGNGTSVLAGISGQTWDGNFTLNSFTFGGQGAVNLGTSAITLTGNRIVSVVNNISTVGGAISGSGRSLQLNGGSSGSGLNLNGASTFDGGLLIVPNAAADFTVTSGNASGLGAGQVNLINSVRAKVALGVNTAVDSLTSGINTPTFTAGSGMTNGTYALVFSGGGGSGAAGTATVSGNAITAVSITSYGKDYTSAPTISITGAGGTGTISNSFGSSSINLNPGTARTLTINGTNASPATYAGIISGTNGSIVKNGAGVQTLTGANTYTGGTSINGGTLSAGSSGALGSTGTISFGGGALQYTASNTTDYSSRFSTAASQAYSVDTNGQTATWATALTSSGGSLSKAGAGTLTLSGVNTYSGNTTIAGGTLVLDSTGSIANSAGINLGTAGSQGTLDLTAKSSFAFGSGQTLSGYGTVNIGTGKLVTINGNLASGNSPGVLTVTGDTALTGTTTTTMELAGNGGVAGTDFDQLIVSGQLTFGGTLNILSYLSYNLDQAGTYHLFDFASQTGNFSLVTVAGTSLTNNTTSWSAANLGGNGFDYAFTLASGDLVVSLAAIPEPSTYAAIFGTLALAGAAWYRRRRRV